MVYPWGGMGHAWGRLLPIVRGKGLSFQFGLKLAFRVAWGVGSYQASRFCACSVTSVILCVRGWVTIEVRVGGRLATNLYSTSIHGAMYRMGYKPSGARVRVRVGKRCYQEN